MFSFLCVTGSSLFAAGAMFRGTAAMLPLMLIGRLIFGSGNGSLSSKHIKCFSMNSESFDSQNGLKQALTLVFVLTLTSSLTSS